MSKTVVIICIQMKAMKPWLRSYWFNWKFSFQASSSGPPYLQIGTDVSAKYRGAFCEAKVKKIVKSVKCRVRTILLVFFSQSFKMCNYFGFTVVLFSRHAIYRYGYVIRHKMFNVSFSHFSISPLSFKIRHKIFSYVRRRRWYFLYDGVNGLMQCLGSITWMSFSCSTRKHKEGPLDDKRIYKCTYMFKIAHVLSWAIYSKQRGVPIDDDTMQLLKSI